MVRRPSLCEILPGNQFDTRATNASASWRFDRSYFTGDYGTSHSQGLRKNRDTYGRERITAEMSSSNGLNTEEE